MFLMFLAGVKKNIYTPPFLHAQELHSRNIWKANICIFLKVFIEKPFFQRPKKVLFRGTINNFLQAYCSLGLIKCFKIFHFN